MLFSAGCFIVPEEPEEPVESPIICEGGHYSIKYDEWSFTGCPDDPWNPAGTYWFNADGRMFLIGDPVPADKVFDVYGKCPTSYIEEIFKGKGC